MSQDRPEGSTGPYSPRPTPVQKPVPPVTRDSTSSPYDAGGQSQSK